MDTKKHEFVKGIPCSNMANLGYQFLKIQGPVNFEAKFTFSTLQHRPNLYGICMVSSSTVNCVETQKLAMNEPHFSLVDPQGPMEIGVSYDHPGSLGEGCPPPLCKLNTLNGN